MRLLVFLNQILPVNSPVDILFNDIATLHIFPFSQNKHVKSMPGCIRASFSLPFVFFSLELTQIVFPLKTYRKSFSKANIFSFLKLQVTKSTDIYDNIFKGRVMFRTLSHIYDGPFWENRLRPETINYLFRKPAS